MKIIKKLNPIQESISKIGETKKSLKEEKEVPLVGILPNADAVALNQHIEDRKQGLERRANPDKDPLVKEFIDETASEKSRTLHYDVVDRKELAKVLTEAKKNKQKFKVGKSDKLGYRYFVDIFPIYGSKGALEVDDDSTEVDGESEESLSESLKGTKSPISDIKTAVEWSFGLKGKERDEYIKKASPKILDSLVDGWKENSKKSFMTDSLQTKEQNNKQLDEDLEQEFKEYIKWCKENGKDPKDGKSLMDYFKSAKELKESAAGKYTDRLWDAIENGLIDYETVAEAAIRYLSDDDVEDLARANDWTFVFEDPEDEDDDDYFDDDLEYLNESKKKRNKKISYEDALTKLYSGDWDNERFNDAIMDGEVELPEDEEYLNEDTVKQNGKWVNKGKEGTHGKFKTKKEADAQRKAMFANGYKESLTESHKPSFSELEEWCMGNPVEMLKTLSRIRNDEMNEGDRKLFNDFSFDTYSKDELIKALDELESETNSWIYDSGDFSEEEIAKIEAELYNPEDVWTEEYDIDDLNNDEVYDNFYDLKGLHVYYPNGRGSDPHVYYKDLEMNYYDLEDAMWKDFKDDLGDKLKNLSENELDIEFEKWLKENESYVQNYFLEAATKDSNELDEDLQLYTSSLKDFKPAKEAEELWNEIIEKGKLDDLEYALENVFKGKDDKNASINIEALNDLLVHQKAFIRTLIGLDDAPLEDDDYNEEPVGENEMVYPEDDEEPVDEDTPIEADEEYIDVDDIEGIDEDDEDDKEIEPIDYKVSDYNEDDIPPVEDDEDELEEILQEASSAERKAYKIGGETFDDLAQGKAIARIKNPKAREAAVAAIKAGRKDVVKDFTGDRKLNQADNAIINKFSKMQKAGLVEDAKPEESELKLENKKQSVVECDDSDNDLVESIANGFINKNFKETSSLNTSLDSQKDLVIKESLKINDEEEVVDVSDEEITEALGMPKEDEVNDKKEHEINNIAADSEISKRGYTDEDKQKARNLMMKDKKEQPLNKEKEEKIEECKDGKAQ